MTLQKKNEWNLFPLGSKDDDPAFEQEQKDLDTQTFAFASRWKGREDYLKDPKVLKEALEEYETWLGKGGSMGKGMYYMHLRTSQDESNPQLKAKYNKLLEACKKRGNEIQFFTLRIAKIPKSEQKKFLDYEGLKKYRHFLQTTFARAEHILMEEVEKVITLMESTSYSNWENMLSGFLSKEESEILDAKGKKVKKSFSEIQASIRDPEKKVRDSAAQAVNEIMLKHVDSAEAEINSILQYKKTDDELRKLPRPDSSRHLNDDIESEVVDSLISAVEERDDLPRRYYQLKAKLLGVKKLKYHERNVPYGRKEEAYPYEKALALAGKVFKNLDGEFASIFEQFQKEGKIDVFPHKGKRGGAFCTDNMLCHPTYVLLNYTNKLDDVHTIAHEMGHAINAELMRTQNALNYSVPMCTAEVASTFMEDFVLQEVLREADDETRLSLYMDKIGDDVSTIHRQIACYTFEQALHREYRKKGYLSKEELGKLFTEHMSAYMGEGVEQSPGSENWWISWSHIRTFFYVYSYASGLLISKTLQHEVKKNPAFIDKVKEFLKAGSSDSPKNLFLKLGIDITKKEFWNEGLDEIESLLNETEKLAKKLGKI